MPSERFTNLLASATFKRQDSSGSKVQYTRLDEATRFLQSDDETEQQLKSQLKRDGYRLDELSDDSDLDLVLPPVKREKTFLEKWCCCVLMRKPEKKENPPVLSNDWIIQNHGDIAACVAVFFVLGLMFQTTKKAANYFIALQYPEKSYELDDGYQSQDKSATPIHPMIAEEKAPETNNEPIYHKIGMRDASTLIFYTTLIIVWHAALQEYVFDKCVRRLHLSKTRTSKFSEMGQLFVWFVLNAAWGSSLCYNFGFFQKPSKLWDEWPHDLITWEAKLYYIFQISFWVHQYPELYLQRVKTEEIANRVTYSTVYLILTILPYSLGFWKSGLMLINLHFVGESFISGQNIISSIPFFRPVMDIVNNISSAIFVIVRMISLALTVMTFHLGFAHQPEVDWNTSKTRIFALCVVSLVQIYQMWLFLGNRVKKWREHKRTKRD